MLVAILGIGGPILASIITWILARRQTAATVEHTEAQAAQVIQASALALVEPLEKRVSALNGEVDRLTARIRDLSTDLDRAHAALTEHGIPIP